MLTGFAFEMKFYGTHNFAPLVEIPNIKTPFGLMKDFFTFVIKKLLGNMPQLKE